MADDLASYVEQEVARRAQADRQQRQPQESFIERMMRLWQEGARAPNSQPYNPRTYKPPRVD